MAIQWKELSLRSMFTRRTRGDEPAAGVFCSVPTRLTYPNLILGMLVQISRNQLLSTHFVEFPPLLQNVQKQGGELKGGNSRFCMKKDCKNFQPAAGSRLYNNKGREKLKGELNEMS